MKTIALYGLQMLVGLVALAAGYAKLTGMGFMTEPFAMIGLGKTVLTIAGTIEVLGGVCLLFPHCGAVGAVLLATAMIGTMGAGAGKAISHHGDRARLTVSTISRSGVQNNAPMAPAAAVQVNRGWDI
jgi:uncharacterized membrane protein YphA (DoxX/SURF4 family)